MTSLTSDKRQHHQKTKKLFYAVSTGRTIGIFTDWAEAHASISGYSHAAHKKFVTKEEAEEYLQSNRYNQSFIQENDKYSTSYRNVAHMNTIGKYNTHQHPIKSKETIIHSINEDNNSVYSKSTSTLTLSTIRTECPQEHLATLEVLISSGAGLETLKKVVSDWQKSTSNQTLNI